MLESSLTLYKLIVLYLLKKVNFPLTNAQISEFILEQGYTTYFHLQEAFHELVDSHLISTETRRNTTYYNLTVDGENTLNYFSNLIPDVIRQEADSYLKENKYELRNEFATRSDYYQNGEDYLVRCEVLENNAHLIDLSLTVPPEEAARAIASHWKKKSQDIYAYLMKELL